MEFIEQNIKGVWEIKLKPIEDARGFFMRTYDESLIKERHPNFICVQENHSLSNKKGTVRGLHFQFPPYSEAKLIRALRGKVFDVFVDLRIASETFGKWGAVVLSEEMKNILFVPRGFAHGYCTLTPNAEVIYKVDNYYTPTSEGAIKWDDQDLDIKWPIKDTVISEKDMNQPSLKDFCRVHKGIHI